MTEETDRAVKAITERLTAQGRLVEGGFQAFRIMVIEPEATEDDVANLRLAYFSGAQHLFASIMNILTEDVEPTEADLIRMDKIHTELNNFVDEIKKVVGERK